ncbi:myelin-oligodendrocyte glycoprotein-like isoform X4 [Sminthopsis crassicaudata]
MKVIWSRSLKIVHHYEHGKDEFRDQSPDYQGRTKLVRDSITSGNVTLRIWNITASDEGWYKCHFDSGSHREEANVKLCVSDEGAEQQILPWLIIFTGIIIVDWILSFVFSAVFILRYKEHGLQNLPWPWEINGILAVISAFEIGLAICYLWVLHRFGGFVYREKSDWMELLIWIIFLVYVVFSAAELGIELVLFTCLFLLYITTSSHLHITKKIIFEKAMNDLVSFKRHNQSIWEQESLQGFARSQTEKSKVPWNLKDSGRETHGSRFIYS